MNPMDFAPALHLLRQGIPGSNRGYCCSILEASARLPASRQSSFSLSILLPLHPLFLRFTSLRPKRTPDLPPQNVPAPNSTLGSDRSAPIGSSTARPTSIAAIKKESRPEIALRKCDLGSAYALTGQPRGGSPFNRSSDIKARKLCAVQPAVAAFFTFHSILYLRWHAQYDQPAAKCNKILLPKAETSGFQPRNGGGAQA